MKKESKARSPSDSPDLPEMRKPKSNISMKTESKQLPKKKKHSKLDNLEAPKKSNSIVVVMCCFIVVEKVVVLIISTYTLMILLIVR